MLCGANSDCEAGSHCGADGACLPRAVCADDAECPYGAACGADGLCESQLRTEVRTTPPNVPVDVLFVVDDGPTLCEMHRELVDSLEYFADAIDISRADPRFAVITPDVIDLDGGGGAFRKGPGEYPNCGYPNDFSSCYERSSGVLRASEFLLDQAGSRAAFVAELACLLRVGVHSRSGPSMGLEAMRRALSDPAQAAELLRPGARLAVAFVVDDNDCSDGTFGDDAGPVYADVLAGDAFACEYRRNVEDSCAYVYPSDVGSVITLDGEEKLAFDWCAGGDRAKVEALSSSLDLQCPEGGCANALTPRREYYDFLVDLVAAKNGYGDDRDAAAADIGVVTIGNPDAGARYDRPDEPPGVCGEGRSTYRYELFAHMFAYSYIETGCQRGWRHTFGETDPILGQPVTRVCLERPPIPCDPTLGAGACGAGATCLQQFEFQPEAYFTCSDVVLRVSVDRGAGPIPLAPGSGYRVLTESRRCITETGSPLELQLVDRYEEGVQVTIEYFGAP